MSIMSNYIGNENLHLSEVMQMIEKNARRLLFLINYDGILSGCITDGDIRRYLLSGGAISGSAIEAANKTPKSAKNVFEAQKIYDSRTYTMIPIVDDVGHIIDIYYKESDFNENRYVSLNTPVVINAGGKGTRLDPFTRVLPKPLIPVGELPIIELIMREYQNYECNDFHIIINYKKNLMKAYFSDSGGDYNITWYDEESPLGTGGGLSLLKGKLSSTFFFANCDALLKTDYESMLRFHKDNGNTITMICAYKNINIPYGVIEMGKDGVIEQMREKPLMSFLANTGIYIVEPEVIYDIEDDEVIGFPDIVEREKAKGRKIAAYPVSENDWMDMGQISELEKMRIKLYGK